MKKQLIHKDLVKVFRKLRNIGVECDIKMGGFELHTLSGWIISVDNIGIFYVNPEGKCYNKVNLEELK